MSVLSLTFTVCVLAMCPLFITVSGSEILKHPGFESKKLTRFWACNQCTMKRTKKVKLFGKRSLFVKDRSAKWSGPRQEVTLVGNQRYSFTAYIYLKNLAPGFMYHYAELSISCLDSQGEIYYIKYGVVPYIFKRKWTKLGGIRRLPAEAISCKAYVQVSEPEANYYLDEMSLQAVPDLADWRAEAETRIEQIRKADVTLTLGAGWSSDNIEVELTQTSHEFAFGTAVGGYEIVNESLTAYQNFVYDNFEWAVLENALKWRPMEWNQGTIKYERSAPAISALRARGMKIRGHAVFWGVDKKIQDWVKALSKTELLAAIATRMDGVITNTTGQLEHWDVNNENLHGDFYERNTEDPDITQKMFHDVRAIDSDVKLFLNDFNVVQGNGLTAMALRNQAIRYVEDGVPIYGVGVQSHFPSSARDMTAIKGRLDTVAEAGLPMWITEITVNEANVTLKAEALTDLLTMYFSHPQVEGLLLWGFWENRISKANASLAEGDDVTPNEAGQAYLDLYHTTWRTNVSQPITAQQPVNIRAFKGDYTLKVKEDGSVVKTQTFTLDDNGQALTIDAPTK